MVRQHIRQWRSLPARRVWLVDLAYAQNQVGEPGILAEIGRDPDIQARVTCAGFSDQRRDVFALVPTGKQEEWVDRDRARSIAHAGVDRLGE